MRPQWWKDVIRESRSFSVDPAPASLIERAVADDGANLSHSGALVVHTGTFTGRATEDKYVVEDQYSLEKIDWSNKLRRLSPETFATLRELYLKTINEDPMSLYVLNHSAGSDPNHSLGLEIVTTSASHALFCQNMFLPATDHTPVGVWRIYHHPEGVPEHERFGLRSSTVIALSFETREILIMGTGYAGEIKKSVFTVMNTLLPDRGVLPVHAGAAKDGAGRVSVFFGLSGTGKTTLSTDEGMTLIGDDEHGITDKSIFNIEGGCYAKTYKLNPLKEPSIASACERFGTLLENVALDPKTRAPLYDDSSRTENGRASYPIRFLPDFDPCGQGELPRNIFFLAADAMGVLPAVAKLTPEEASFYFLSGYTSKLAGTELGITTPRATFSHCFGSPFMIRRPQDYGDLLKQLVRHAGIDIWLVNTGWYGGPYGVGKRYDISVTRSIIRSIQSGGGTETEYARTQVFGLRVPKTLPGVKSEFLDPQSLWKSPEAYEEAARGLKRQFDENYKF